MAALPACQAIVYPKVEYSDTETAYLQPLVFTICFPGPVPRRLIQNNIPIEISVAFPSQCQGIAFPEVQPSAWGLNDDCIEESKVVSVVSSTNSSDDIPIPFLPLPAVWDPKNTSHWAKLMKEIERWLVVDVGVTTVPQWMWGCDAFWLAFIGAYPLFPSEKWEMWDPAIPLNGQFIEGWLTKDTTDGACLLGTSDTLSYVWDEFCRHAALFYTSPLVASD